MIAKRLKVKEAAKELNVCSKSIHNYIKKHSLMLETTKDDCLPSSPTNGLRGIAINNSISGRITWRIDVRDINEYIENSTREVLNKDLNCWRRES